MSGHSAEKDAGAGAVREPRIGSLFSGYGGLDMGVQGAIGGSVAWHVEHDPAPSKILAHHWPGVPNYGDVMAVDWSQVEPVDVITGGSPCQDLSHAGKRQGMTEGTRSNLWVAMREAIAHLRPGLVVWENVRGAYSAAADSEVEPCAGCVGDGSGVLLRALGRVLGDLSDLGYDCRWHGLRAADVGAPHGRFRVFVVAHPASDSRRLQHGDGGAADAGCFAGEVPPARRLSAESQPSGDGDTGRAGLTLLPTPRAGDGTKGGPNQRGSSGDFMLPSAVTHLLPTPAAQEPGGTLERYHARLREHDGRESAFAPLSMLVQLLPPPTSMDSRASGGNPDTTGTHGTTLTDATARRPQDWGQYAAAIHCWEQITRPAPSPTEVGPKGKPRLSAAFSEWLMGLPSGHVTSVPGLSRNDQLKALGNGVVPQQAKAATRSLLDQPQTGGAAA